ncbi:ATP-binding protein [Actinomadura sp. LOL_016]|uniref:ATP-binding protein n=1 Tax=unclassified Actinomadura TaxID=2626254 RepID=UPI003A80477A
MLAAVRAFVRGLLLTSPRLDDVELVASEIAGNAIRHAPSGGDGGRFLVTVSLRPGWARIAVSGSGTGRWNRSDVTKDGIDEYGRGLLVVAGCADRVGHEASAHGQTMWAEFTWTTRRASHDRGVGRRCGTARGAAGKLRRHGRAWASPDVRDGARVGRPSPERGREGGLGQVRGLLSRPVRFVVVRYLRRRAVRYVSDAFDLAERRDVPEAVRCHERSTTLWRAVDVLRRP